MEIEKRQTSSGWTIIYKKDGRKTFRYLTEKEYQEQFMSLEKYNPESIDVDALLDARAEKKANEAIDAQCKAQYQRMYENKRWKSSDPTPDQVKDIYGW